MNRLQKAVAILFGIKVFEPPVVVVKRAYHRKAKRRAVHFSPYQRHKARERMRQRWVVAHALGLKKLHHATRELPGHQTVQNEDGGQ